MSIRSHSNGHEEVATKVHHEHSEGVAELGVAEVEAQARPAQNPYAVVAAQTAPRSLGAGSALAISMFAVTLTALAMSLMGWRDVSVTNAFVGNLFFAAGLGMFVTAQWEMAIGNGFSYTVFAGFGAFYAGYGAILTPSFGVREAYGDDVTMYYNALGFYFIMWMVFTLALLVASLPSNLVFILIFAFVKLAFLFISASYMALADGKSSATGLLKTGGVFCFLAGLLGWYLTFAMLLQDAIIELPLGDTSRYFGGKRKRA
ncbi:GPR1/FUN34/yaaH family-domain-containing protein [Achaetomium macrosporum]|uniref:GPR1/FUN34/yaaH family-domain-containing protein n=1 Tax=Achaetomium macrosporum TaxID=79813 RepID=A0AAN7C5K2_9PEZI|nr:GPR1/FUN34/yaaH family-domain-containing protein [Achaetomium macrosporum]